MRKSKRGCEDDESEWLVGVYKRSKPCRYVRRFTKTTSRYRPEARDRMHRDKRE